MTELTDEVEVSPSLAKLIGAGPHTRITLTQRLWKYIFAHGLARGSGPSMMILPDVPLSKVLGTRREVGIDELTKLASKHIRLLDGRKRKARPARSNRSPARGSDLASPISHWLWVSTPEFYENPDGSSSISVGADQGWWTCSPQTRAGDLALLYRATWRKDIAYLFLATSDAFSIRDDPFADARGWEWACDIHVLFEFSDPLPLSVLRSNKEFWDWSALKINFQGRAFAIDRKRWEKLIALALPSNPGLGKFVGRAAEQTLPLKVRAERDIEDALSADLNRLRKAGYDLELWKDPKSGRSGRQFVCAAVGGRIDLLCRDRKSGQLVVVELKNVIATEQTYTQAWRYLAWVQRFLAKRRAVRALVIARGCDSQFEIMAEASGGRVRFLSLVELGFE